MNSINTNICRWGNSRGIRLPRTFMELAGLDDNDEVSLTVENDAIIIKKITADRPSYPSILERFASYQGDYVPEEWDTGPSAGKEF